MNVKISDDPGIAVKQMARELANNSIVNKALARYIEQILEAVSQDTIQPLRDRVSQQDAELERLRRELEEIRALLKDPAAVRINYLRGDIACQALIAEAREAAFIEAAEIAENYSELRDIDWWLNATKKEVSADACVSIAAALRAKAEETRT